MNKYIQSAILFFSALLLAGVLFSCEDFFNPEQGVTVTEDQLYTDWYEYRAVALGMYGLQQQLVEQLMVLGELRGDLLTVTDNADEDLMEIYNFNVSKDNKYASPQNFFKLIAATNRLISILEERQPRVTNLTLTEVNNYDKLYGEALCMRAWAYFNAARIYGKVPFIDQRLSTIEEIEQFINSPGSYVDSVYIKYSINGFNNDTIYNQPVKLEKNYWDLDRIIRHFTKELETKVKVGGVGVNHYIENKDESWEVSVWSSWSYNTLLGHMYLTLGDLSKSMAYFEKVVDRSPKNTNNRYQLDDAFAGGQWANIFNNIDNREHIYTLWFNKANQQTNDFQRLFEPWGVNDYMLKPTQECVHKWETQWIGGYVRYDYEIPDSTRTMTTGFPGDNYRGFGTSYLYARGDQASASEYIQMLQAKMDRDTRTVEQLMEGVDTVVYKYSMWNTRYDHDPIYIIYRAAGVNLYMAEIYNHWSYLTSSGTVTSTPLNALKLLNDGSFYNSSNSREQLGVRGRVGLPAVEISDFRFIFDPFTRKVIGWKDLRNNLQAKQFQIEDDILEERARELAFEGERFYDLMRISKRRNDPSYLASRVSAKYPASRRQSIYNYLLNENNWYINYFQ